MAKTLPLPGVSTAFAAKTLPLPRVSTAIVAKTLPLPCGLPGRLEEAIVSLETGLGLEPGNKPMAKTLKRAKADLKVERDAAAARAAAEEKERLAKERVALRKAAGQSAFDRLPDTESAAYAGWPVTVAMSDESGRCEKNAPVVAVRRAATWTGVSQRRFSPSGR